VKPIDGYQILFALLLLAPAVTKAQSWKSVYTAPNGLVLYVDSGSVSRRGSIATIDVQADRGVKEVSEFDCVKKTIKPWKGADAIPIASNLDAARASVVNLVCSSPVAVNSAPQAIGSVQTGRPVQTPAPNLPPSPTVPPKKWYQFWKD
jgi:hypothetical protein